MRGKSALGEYTLEYDFNALCVAEEHVGPLGEAMQKMSTGSLTIVRALFWAGLQKNHPEMTLNQAGNIAQQYGFETVGEAVGKGIESAFAEAPKGNGAAAPS
jgi:hypothetical protein